MKIEIYEKKTGRVVSTQTITDMQSFLFYWRMQCDRETFAWREAR